MRSRRYVPGRKLFHERQQLHLPTGGRPTGRGTPGRGRGVVAERGGEVDGPAWHSLPMTRLRKVAMTCGAVNTQLGRPR